MGSVRDIKRKKPLQQRLKKNYMLNKKCNRSNNKFPFLCKPTQVISFGWLDLRSGLCGHGQVDPTRSDNTCVGVDAKSKEQSKSARTNTQLA